MFRLAKCIIIIILNNANFGGGKIFKVRFCAHNSCVSYGLYSIHLMKICITKVYAIIELMEVIFH